MVAHAQGAGVGAPLGDAMRHATAEATRDRLRFLMRLDHELKNPLTAIRAGLANIDHAGSLGTARGLVVEATYPL